jgi:hypothetical protein
VADRSEQHPWGTCDSCGVDLGGVCCYSPHQLGDYGTLCDKCHADMRREAEERRTIIVGGSPVGGRAKGVKKKK